MPEFAEKYNDAKEAYMKALRRKEAAERVFNEIKEGCASHIAMVTRECEQVYTADKKKNSFNLSANLRDLWAQDECVQEEEEEEFNEFLAEFSALKNKKRAAEDDLEPRKSKKARGNMRKAHANSPKPDKKS